MLKRIAIGVGVLLLIAVVVVGWLWHEVTALPDWYEDDAAAYEAPQEGAPPPQWIALDERGDPIEPVEPWPEHTVALPPEGVDAPPAPRTRRRARSHELRGFHRARRGAKRPAHQAVRASRAHYQDGELEVGMVLDLSRIPKDKLSDKDRSLFDRAVRNFPGLTKRDVYVGVETEPVVVDGYFQLGADPQVRVGNLRYPLAKAAEKLGMTEARLRREANLELQRMGLVDPTTAQ